MDKLYQQLDAIARKQEFQLVQRASHEGYQAGAQYVLSYLAEFIEDVKDSDLWADFDMDNYEGGE
jgi:hypothetical protein